MRALQWLCHDALANFGQHLRFCRNVPELAFDIIMRVRFPNFENMVYALKKHRGAVGIQAPECLCISCKTTGRNTENKPPI